MNAPPDTLRILVSRFCNRSCVYCCNEKPQFARQFRSVNLDSVQWDAYRVICISGGEPLLFPDRVEQVCGRIRRRPPKEPQLVVLYTNGDLLNRATFVALQRWGVERVNVSVHDYMGSCGEIQRIKRDAGELLTVRFHLQDRYEREARSWGLKGVEYQFWKMDDCDRPNEDRVIPTCWDWDRSDRLMRGVLTGMGRSRP